MAVGMVKLTTGDELICDYTEIPEGGYLLKDVVTLARVEKDKIGMIPFLPYCDTTKGLKIDPRHVLTIVELDEQMVVEYQKAFNKIITPPTPKLALVRD